MNVRTGPAVVMGVGNVLLRDDGVGPRIVRELEAMCARDPLADPRGTRFVDGGTLGLDLIQALRGARSLLLVDAVNLGQRAGAISVLHGDAIMAVGGRGAGSVPGSVGELLAVARLMGWLPDPVALVAIQVGDTGFGSGLSDSVEAAVPEAVMVVRRELRALDELVAAGCPARPVMGRQGEATA